MALKIRRIPRENCHYSGETLIEEKTVNWLAGTAVQIAPCSAQIPCKQGILQGISANSAIAEIATRKSLRNSMR